MDRLSRLLDRLLRDSGTKQRRWRENGDTAADFVKKAATQALDRAALKPKDIDLLIYLGVGRACLEPATANIFQSQLGLINATCFDILDACLSWLRALHVSHQFLKAGVYKNIMIINAEFNAFGSFGTRTIRNIKEMEYLFAGHLTIGEAATATIL